MCTFHQWGGLVFIMGDHDNFPNWMQETKNRFLGRYIAEKLVFNQHGKDFCSRKSTGGKIAKKSEKSVIFRWKNRDAVL